MYNHNVVKFRYLYIVLYIYIVFRHIIGPRPTFWGEGEREDTRTHTCLRSCAHVHTLTPHTEKSQYINTRCSQSIYMHTYA
jgi:hypothetical protein